MPNASNATSRYLRVVTAQPNFHRTGQRVQIARVDFTDSERCPYYVVSQEGEMPMIELRHLRYFVAVAEELNFRRAAERIHIDQTPLSRTIRDLEDQLGVLLFMRMPRKLRLTPAGARLLKETHKLFVRLERTRRVVRATDVRHRAPLRIGVADGIAQPKLSECFAGWQALAPETPLELSEMSADELTAALRREEIDAGISFGLAEDDAVAQEPAWSYPLLALLPVKHELATLEAVALADLLAFPLISCKADRQPGLLQQMRTIVHRYNPAPTIAGEASSLSGYITRIAAGMGVGLADAGHVATLRRTDVVAVPLQESEHIVTRVLHKHQRCGLPGELQRFLTHAKMQH
ncbi:Hca operon transcriptional activator [compost metagenome]